MTCGRCWPVTLVLLLLLAACGSKGGIAQTPEPTEAPITSSTTTINTSTTTTALPTTQSLAEPGEYPRCIPPDDRTAPITFLPNWEQGEVIDLERKEIEDRAGRPIELGTSYAPVEIVVREANSDSFELTWTLGEAFLDLDDISIPDSELLDQFLELAKMRFEYETDETGLFLGVTNPDEIADRMETAMDLLIEITGESLTEGQGIDVRSLMQSDTFIQTVASQDIALYHGIYGLVLDPTQIERYETLLPNAFGGEPFPAIQTIEVTSTANEYGCVVVAMTTEPDPEAFVEILMDSMPDSAAPTTDEERAELAEMEIRNDLEFIYDPDTGRMRQVSGTQTVSLGDDYRIETVILTEQPGS